MYRFEGFLREATKIEIQNKLVAAGMDKMTNSGRVGNPNKLSDSEFITLIKDTFKETSVYGDEIPQVTKYF